MGKFDKMYNSLLSKNDEQILKMYKNPDHVVLGAIKKAGFDIRGFLFAAKFSTKSLVDATNDDSFSWNEEDKARIKEELDHLLENAEA